MGLELEGKAQFNDFQLEGSMTYQWGEDKSTGNKDITLAPHLMVKLGGVYDFGNGYTLGIFDQYFDDVVGISEPTTSFKPNPKAENYHLLTANLSIDVNRALNLRGISKTTFSVYGDNLLDEDIYIPESSGLVNTVPGYSGRAFYAKVSVKF